ncbi:MAG: RNA 2',3'-cyclic phosphodiesterase [Anaerolineae bacterium]|nr:RNA 2',3'-cyclic phosphodiesterase [Anaerolineae bacterium]
MMTTLRVFIAIDLPDDARAKLADVQSRLKEMTPPNTVRWTAPQNIHLTLHFLGDVAVADLHKIIAALELAGAACVPFSLALEGVGCFPHTRRPRIVWVGISGQMEILAQMHQDLGAMLQKNIGFRPESRPYSPHLTIGRVKKGIPPRRLTQLGQAIESQQRLGGQLIALEVKEIKLIKSELKPDGPVYTPLALGLLRGVRK